jgi:two-component system, cell cycle response regulator CpdR
MARILIAEDDEPVRGFVKRALEMDGHIIVAEPDGAAALERLEAEGGAFDLLLSDIRMPLMDGIALALAAGRSFPGLPILLMTGFADQRERAHDLDSIVQDVVTKPFSLVEIRAAVARALVAEKRRAA